MSQKLIKISQKLIDRFLLVIHQLIIKLSVIKQANEKPVS